MAEDTEKKILMIARKHFVQNGFAATRMQEIANEAGINKAMLHYYFRSKEKLFEEITIHTMQSIIPKIGQAMASEGSFMERVERIVDTYIDVLTQDPELPVFVMMELSQKRETFIDLLKKQVLLFPKVQGFISEMMKDMESGKIRSFPPIHLFLNIIGMTVFPFVAKPVYCTVFDTSDEAFNEMMQERKTLIMDFLRHALRTD